MGARDRNVGNRRYAGNLCWLLAPTLALALLLVAKPSASVEIKAPPGAPKACFLWKITSGKNVLFLLGSVHLVKSGFYPLPAAVEQAFAGCSNLALEVDESKQDPARVQVLTMERGMYKPGDQLSNHISKGTQESLNAYLESNPTLAAACPKMKPWLLSLMIPVGELEKRGYDPQQGVDKHFLSEAQATEKKVDEVESADFQLDLISGFPDDLQEKLLVSSLLDMKSLDADVAQMMQAWKDGDAKAMEVIAFKDEREHPDLKPISEKLIFERNIGMTKKIEEYLKLPGRYFVCVGAGHLIGDRGILKLLKDKDYKVEQVTSPAKGAVEKDGAN
jgi:uncharacterized protein YbaP (TraB family)